MVHSLLDFKLNRKYGPSTSWCVIRLLSHCPTHQLDSDSLVMRKLVRNSSILLGPQCRPGGSLEIRHCELAPARASHWLGRSLPQSSKLSGRVPIWADRVLSRRAGCRPPAWPVRSPASRWAGEAPSLPCQYYYWSPRWRLCDQPGPAPARAGPGPPSLRASYRDSGTHCHLELDSMILYCSSCTSMYLDVPSTYKYHDVPCYSMVTPVTTIYQHARHQQTQVTIISYYFYFNILYLYFILFSYYFPIISKKNTVSGLLIHIISYFFDENSYYFNYFVLLFWLFFYCSIFQVLLVLYYFLLFQFFSCCQLFQFFLCSNILFYYFYSLLLFCIILVII
jgi:hypothetical protein